jgi:putative addiction module component (TIGR02574 family)
MQRPLLYCGGNEGVLPVPSDKSLLAELLELSPAERIQLAEDLWDSVVASPETMPSLTAAQIAEIECRRAEHARNPSRAIPWEAVRARLWSRFE